MTMVVAVAIAATCTATEAALALPAAEALVAVTFAPLGAAEDEVLGRSLLSKRSASLWPTFLLLWERTLSLLVSVLFKSEAWEALSFLTPASLWAKTDPNSKESPLLGT